ncbi:tautomerase family protein [Leisingera methylohalidivorans]|uniref:4-oxalocrotonate tautomerase n=1 Tax=Leisingera methylohalidivorans DSM 14336 TaxID=999552 RepID=V9VTU3_9RHOB|nr:tautomerase family protein [Leisingera methylohalidivorans]AHD02171.1 4-oxalocrotonate tautomerase [Leisingera methylohalidivorans DSM 14336]
MPHVIIKHFDATLTDVQRSALSDAITKAATQAFGCSEHAVSIALRPVNPDDWSNSVFAPDIEGRPQELIRSPDYSAI